MNRTFWTAFFGSLTGKIVAALIVGALVFVGITPDQIVGWLAAGAVSPITVRVVALGAALLIVALWAGYAYQWGRRDALAGNGNVSASERVSVSVDARKISASERPDYDRWDQHDRFTLLELAWLWEDYEPKGYGLPDYIRARYEQLAGDAKAHKLRLHYGDDIAEIARDALDQIQRNKIANPKWTATRPDARSYATEIGERPKFLFPMERV